MTGPLLAPRRSAMAKILALFFAAVAALAWGASTAYAQSESASRRLGDGWRRIRIVRHRRRPWRLGALRRDRTTGHRSGGRLPRSRRGRRRLHTQLAACSSTCVPSTNAWCRTRPSVVVCIACRSIWPHPRFLGPVGTQFSPGSTVCASPGLGFGRGPGAGFGAGTGTCPATAVGYWGVGAMPDFYARRLGPLAFPAGRSRDGRRPTSPTRR